MSLALACYFKSLWFPLENSFLKSSKIFSGIFPIPCALSLPKILLDLYICQINPLLKYILTKLIESKINEYSVLYFFFQCQMEIILQTCRIFNLFSYKYSKKFFGRITMLTKFVNFGIYLWSKIFWKKAFLTFKLQFFIFKVF